MTTLLPVLPPRRGRTKHGVEHCGGVVAVAVTVAWWVALVVEVLLTTQLSSDTSSHRGIA